MVAGQSSILVVGSGHAACGLATALGVARVDDARDAWATDAAIVYADEISTDAAERDPVRAEHVCVTAPCELWRQQRGCGNPFIYIGSGCLWRGPYRADGRPFTVDDPADPQSLVGQLRANAEDHLRSIGIDGLTLLRPRLIYSADDHPDNATVKFLQFDRLVDVPQSMTSVGTIARTVRQATRGRLHPGTYCVYDRGTPTPYMLAVYMSEAGLRPTPLPLREDELDEVAPRRVHVVMRDAMFESLVQPPDTVSSIMADARAIIYRRRAA